MSTLLARRFKVEVSPDNTVWTALSGIHDFAPSEKPTMVSTATYDTNGFDSSEKTLTTWMAVVKMNRIVTASALDPGQQLAAGTRFQFGDNARLYIRWYDRSGLPEAYAGRAVVDYSQTKTAVADVEEITVTFNGDGILSAITNPFTATAPTITGASPSGAAAGATVTLTGSNFTGVSAVKFGGTNATSYTFVSDTSITAVVPAGTAGSAAITVTNSAGTSSGFAYTRG